MISENYKLSLDNSVSAFLQIRLALKLSRKEFADVLGINEDTIGKWERGKSNPTLNIAQIKRFDVCLQRVGLTWQDLPDNIGDPNSQLPKYKRTRQKLK